MKAPSDGRRKNQKRRSMTSAISRYLPPGPFGISIFLKPSILN